MNNQTTTKEALEPPKLAPCPFCGGKAESSPTTNGEGGVYVDRWAIICRACNFEMIEMATEGDKPFYATALRTLTSKWNSRVSAPIAPVVDLKAIIESAIQDLHRARTHEPKYCCPEDEGVYDRLLTRSLIEKLTAAAPASTVAPQQSDWLLDCPMCNAPKSFAIDSSDDAVGFCLAERRNWRIIDTTCVTDGCFQPKATFGDLCMGCLAKAVDSE